MVSYNKSGGGGGNKRVVEFPSEQKRDDVHEAIKNRAASINQNNEELRCLFDLAQPLGFAEKNEPRPGEWLWIEFEADNASDIDRCANYLKQMSDPDLQWFGRQLDP